MALQSRNVGRAFENSANCWFAAQRNVTARVPVIGQTLSLAE